MYASLKNRGDGTPSEDAIGNTTDTPTLDSSQPVDGLSSLVRPNSIIILILINESPLLGSFRPGHLSLRRRGGETGMAI